ncbi:MAG: hypothetical protein Tsb0020_24470 [Haliangiales bacterium]
MAVALGASLGLAACGGEAQEPADPASAQQRIQDTVPAMSQNVSDTLAYWGEDQNLAALQQSLSALQSSFDALGFAAGDDGELIPVGPPSALSRAMPRALPQAMGGFALAAADDGLDADMSAEIQALAEKIFSEENFEGEGVFLVRGADVCDSGDVIDTECAAEVDKLELRVIASVADDGLDLDFELGPNRDQPISLELRSDRVIVMVDLAETKEAVAFLSSLSGEAAELPEVMRGVVAFSLLVNGERDVELQVAVLEAIRFEANDVATGTPIVFTTEVRGPLYSVRMSPDEFGLSYNLGRTTLSAPLSLPDSDNVEVSGLTVDLQGLTYDMTLSAGSDTVAIRNVGLGAGTSTVKLDDTELFAIDLNPDHGRRFDIDVSADAAGLPLFEVSPAFDLALRYDFSAILDSSDEAAAIADDNVRITLSGDAPAVQVVEEDLATGFAGGLRVVSGQLTLSADSAAADVVVGADECLVELDSTDSGDGTDGTDSGDALASLSVSACQ